MKVVFDTKNNAVTVNGKSAEERVYEFFEGESVDVLFIPKSYKLTYVPVATSIKIKEKPTIYNPYLYFIEYSDTEEVFKICVKPQILSENAKVLKQETLYAGGMQHTATVTSAEIFFDTENYFHKTPAPGLEDADIKVLDGAAPLFIVTGKTDGDGGEKKEFISITAWEGDYKQLLTLSADRIEITENGITAGNKLFDMQGHEVSEKYAYEGGAYVLQEKVSAAKILDYAEELLPYVFVEAVLAGDEKTAKKLSARDLHAPAESLKNFFMNAVAVADEPFLEYIEDSVPLIVPDGNNFKCVRFYFTVSGGLITNINSD